jgi:hypothetical protein
LKPHQANIAFEAMTMKVYLGKVGSSRKELEEDLRKIIYPFIFMRLKVRIQSRVEILSFKVLPSMQKC